MAASITLIALFVLSFLIIGYSKIKSEYIFILLLMTFGVLGTSNMDSLTRTAIVAAVSFIYFCIVRRINVNAFIKASNIIYIITVILLVVALLMPSYNGVHRYVFIGSLIIEPAHLVVFSILPICSLINKMKRITLKELFLIIILAFTELALVFLQPNLKPVIVMCIVFLIMLIKVKVDNRINVSWFPIIAINVMFVFGCIAILFTPYGWRYLDAILTRGMNDPMGRGYQLQVTDMVIRAVKVIGPADLSDVYGNAQTLERMPFLSFAAKYGWFCVALLILTVVIFILRLYFMSAKIKNSFARYVSFGIATYFAVGCVFHVLTELLTGSYASQFIFMGSLTTFLIHSVLLAIVFALYKQRNMITVGRQLDIDYDMTDAVLKGFVGAYQRKLQTSNDSQSETKLLRARIKELESEREKWKNKSKSLLEINKNYDKYESELGFESDEKNLVFISYNHFDEKHAVYLAERLEKLGLRAWHFKRDMKSEGGTNDYAVAIHRAIRKARIFVVILSKHSMTSEHVKNEVCLAFNQLTKGTVMLPIIIEEVSIEEDEAFGYYLCRQDITKAFTPPIKKQLDEFAKKVESAYR